MNENSTKNKKKLHKISKLMSVKTKAEIKENVNYKTSSLFCIQHVFKILKIINNKNKYFVSVDFSKSILLIKYDTIFQKLCKLSITYIQFVHDLQKTAVDNIF